MANKEITSQYWFQKFNEKNWQDYRTTETGTTFDTSVHKYKKDYQIGDRILWYKSDNNKGIYFITKVLAAPKDDNKCKTGYSMTLQVIKSLVKKPFVIDEEDYNGLLKYINSRQMSSAVTNISNQYTPKKIYEDIIGEEEDFLQRNNVDVSIDTKDLKIIEDIKRDYINNSEYAYNPFHRC